MAPAGIRPSEGRVKLAIFNMLGDLPLGAVVLDLCAGSGALGIEALSRGAERAVFVDSSPRAVSSIRRNLETLGYADRGQVHRDDAVRFCERHPDVVRGSDLILCDPPYNDPILMRLLRVLDHGTPVEGVVVVEHGARIELPSLVRLRPERERRYGDTRVTILQAGGEP
ncbi:MAG: RsmD family RNA methyltransferase [Candidatus Dormibacteraeota bacterium]|nr:RsmD family RNA methyltransferase [Candidatus Dormibacteraeota bacterium]